jgi:hypothetical protein
LLTIEIFDGKLCIPVNAGAALSPLMFAALTIGHHFPASAF